MKDVDPKQNDTDNNAQQYSISKQNDADNTPILCVTTSLLIQNKMMLITAFSNILSLNGEKYTKGRFPVFNN